MPLIVVSHAPCNLFVIQSMIAVTIEDTASSAIVPMFWIAVRMFVAAVVIAVVIAVQVVVTYSDRPLHASLIEVTMF